MGRVGIALKRADFGLEKHLVSGGDKPDKLFERCEHHGSVGLSIVHEILGSVSSILSLLVDFWLKFVEECGIYGWVGVQIRATPSVEQEH